MLNEVFNIIKMIELVRNRPGIYDLTKDEHNNKANVENLWKEVADEMGATTADCKRKWASLRNAMSRDLRNEREASLYKRKKKKWYLADHLRFLRNHLNEKKYKDQKGVAPADESIEEEVNCTTEENMNFFDFSTQDVMNEYLSAEETNDSENNISLASVSPSVINETKHFSARPPPPAPSPHKIGHHYRNESVGSCVVNTIPPPPPTQHMFSNHYASNSGMSGVGKETTKFAPAPPPQPSPQNGHNNYMNESPISADESLRLDDRNMTFFKSIIPDILRLSDRKQRLYKQNVIMKLNKILDE